MLNLSITKYFQTLCNCIAMKLIYVVGDMALHIIFVRTIIFFNSQTKSTNVEKEMKNILFLFYTQCLAAWVYSLRPILILLTPRAFSTGIPPKIYRETCCCMTHILHGSMFNAPRRTF